MKDINEQTESQERQWVEDCLRGDKNAFARLVEEHKHSVYNLAYQMCRNTTVAEDLAQTAFIRAYQRLDQYKPLLPFRNWIMGICANLCRNRYRRWQRKRILEQEYFEEAKSRNEICRSDSDHADEIRANIEQALTALPVSLRLPLVLQYMEGMTVHEVATTLQISLSAAKMRLARGRGKMAGILKNQTTRYKA